MILKGMVGSMRIKIACTVVKLTSLVAHNSEEAVGDAYVPETYRSMINCSDASLKSDTASRHFGDGEDRLCSH